MGDKAPLVKTYMCPVEPVATPANDLTTELLEVEFAGTITEVGYIPVAAITGVATNTRKVSVVNAGSAGSGSTEAAALQFDSGVNAAAHDKKVITLSGTSTNLVVAAGDVLKWVSLHVGTGIADPGGAVIVKIARS